MNMDSSGVLKLRQGFGRARIRGALGCMLWVLVGHALFVQAGRI